MFTVLFRADGSSELGMGHIMRGLALAESLAKEDVTTVFAARPLEPRVSEVITQQGYEVEVIATTSLEEDADLTACCADKRGIRTVITDICHSRNLQNPILLRRYHRRLADSFETVALSAGTDLDIPADVVVNPYVGAGISDRPSEARLYLAGPKYFIFRPEFTARPGRRSIPRIGKRVLITMGGGDNSAPLRKVIDALLQVGLPEMTAKVLLGASSRREVERAIRDGVGSYEGHLEILGHSSDIAGMMLWADLAVIGDGLTKYEAAVTGTPSIMLSRPDSLQELNERFAAAGSTIHLGDWMSSSTEAIADEIRRLLESPDERRRMSRRGRRLLDGAGASRVAKIVKGVTNST